MSTRGHHDLCSAEMTAPQDDRQAEQDAARMQAINARARQIMADEDQMMELATVEAERQIGEEA